MRYVTGAVIQPYSYIAALLFLCYFSCINLSLCLPLGPSLFPSLSLSLISILM